MFQIFKGDDFLGQSVSSKAPPSEKPPPPPLTPETPKKEVWPPPAPQQQKIVIDDDDDIDEQEKEIIASLENEEREHLKYKERVQAMRCESSLRPFLAVLFANLIVDLLLLTSRELTGLLFLFPVALSF